MNEIANIIAQLEAQKAAIGQALEALRDFDQFSNRSALLIALLASGQKLRKKLSR